ncbi:FAD-dependent tricarballylate dehydrogenase TcuA [Cryobacterium sp. Y82]|uniref:FAD-dependent tricarballylate dehydrogenase TcuA n=1 Tax=Cryobacterium sp. Y82 TaxID=2045017 RepID=UPI001E656DF7|nr:FAD-dependent tricarballylate dehydrogenase TcuA [Cryobacterium sp. Y82]
MNSEKTEIAERADVVIVGGGNAGFSAAHAAIENGASVVLLEKTSEAAAGGNSFYTAGAYRVIYDDIRDLLDVLDDDLTGQRIAKTVVPPYPAEEFAADMVRITDGRCDRRLTDTLVSRSTDTLRWLHSKGIQFRLMYERQSFERDGGWTFFGNLVVGTVDGGRGLIAQHTSAARASGVDIRYRATMTSLLRGPDGEVVGVEYTDAHGEKITVHAASVVLAAGGFEADSERREKYLGPGWGKALVRGNPSNTGEVLDIALAAGAQRFGDWSSCHSVAWDAGGPPNGGNRELTNQMTRQSYPLGIVVNVEGNRFVDEGADYRNYTYAKYGREILRQPQGIAFQLFDATTRPMLRTQEYDSAPITCETADTVEELAAKLNINVAGLKQTVDEFNASIVEMPFDPAVKDGRAARVSLPKSNWALALETGPFYGYAVSCGITFTFGGVKINDNAQAVDDHDVPIPGLYVAGEMVGGLFSGNYPGGSGLTSGSVFGRIAGTSAAEAVKSR